MSKEIKLIKLELNNFKGIRHFSLDLNGENATIYGDNGTGKTTLFDAFTWLLFGKDSNDKTDFEIKPLNENGEVKQHKIEHSVEGKFLIIDDGVKEELTLKRIFYEKWTKKRGSIHESFSGHSTDYFINGIPVKQKEYQDKIAQLIREDIFKLLTNPRYFNENLSWQERRELLFNLIGKIDDKDVVGDDKELAELLEKIQGRDIEAHIKMIKAQQKQLNKEINSIPVRIDELYKNMPNIEGLNKPEIEKQIESINQKISKKHEAISDLRNGREVAELKQKLIDLNGELKQIELEYSGKKQEKRYALLQSLNEAEGKMKLIQERVKDNRSKKEALEDELKQTEEELNRLREEYKALKNKTFTFDEQDKTCPVCGQKLPSAKLQEIKQKALEEFNQKKAEEIRVNVEKGKAVKTKYDKLQNDIAILDGEHETFLKELEGLNETIEKLKNDIAKLSQQEADISKDKKYSAKLKEKQQIEEAIKEAQSKTDEAVEAIKKEIEALESQKTKLQKKINNLIIYETYQKRIQELEEDERRLAKEYEALEKELFLAEKLIRRRAEYTEARVNDLFENVRFKLFEQQINGELIPTCICTYKGVPYGKGLNNSAEINAGLEIIHVLMDKHGVKLPIWIDNAESIIRVYKVDTQMIKLVVSKDKHLEIEKGV